MPTHKMSFTRNLNYISWTLVWLIVLSIIFYINPIDNGIALLRFLALVTVVPGILLHFKYYFPDKNKTVQLEEDHMELIHNNNYQRFNYTEINKVESHYNYWPGKKPWGRYN